MRSLLAVHARWIIAAALALGLGLPALDVRADTQIEVRWSHPAPNTVAGFRIHTRTGSGAFDAGTDVGVPPLGLDGRYAASLAIPEGVDVYIRLSAYNGIGSSPLSDRENTYRVDPQQLGQPGRPVLVIE